VKLDFSNEWLGGSRFAFLGHRCCKPSADPDFSTMSLFSKRQLPLLFIASILLLVVVLFLLRPATPVDPPPAPSEIPTAGLPPEETRPAVADFPEAPPPALSILASAPDWTLLEKFQETITREDFEQQLSGVFTTGDAWRNVIEIDEEEARIQTGFSPDEGTFHLRFAPAGETVTAPRNWRSTAELPAAPLEKPLDGLHIAIDPGHIGGKWAKMEERWFVVGDGQPVREGNMTLKVANLLKPRLESLGATVSLVRDKLEPVTPIRPEALLSLAQESSAPDDSPASLQRLTERLFYRTAEIRARAELVNETIKPDLVLCLHFNAESWGDPNQPTLIQRSHLHLLLNGGYNNEEVMLADQRFALLHKLLQRTHEEEALVGASVADAFAEISGLPPYRYPANSPNARPVNDHPYLWARNLLANRLYDCPVIFMEPYVMNSILDHARIQAGDYEGLQEIEGKLLPSIFREYTDALVAGLTRHYGASREVKAEAPPSDES
jgi:N-acetylmuramoyl-L-alanine amidase